VVEDAGATEAEELAWLSVEVLAVVEIALLLEVVVAFLWMTDFIVEFDGRCDASFLRYKSVWWAGFYVDIRRRKNEREKE